MKIPRSIRAIYNERLEIIQLLQARVDELITGSKRPEWFYRSRIKALESFAQKLETGRVTNPVRMEDFFACSIVVENRGSIQEAVELVELHCEVLHRRPPIPGRTHKRPDSFSFDDLRLYVRLKPDEMTPASPLEETPFEIQVKTFLQHAWSIATHDLVYKGGRIDWGRARIAFQIRAMLEHAEVTIEKADVVAESDALALIDPDTQQLIEVLAWIERTWEDDVLPRDRVRLSSTIHDLLDAVNVNLEDLAAAIDADTGAGRGTASRNLSPYGIAVQSLATHRRDKFLAFLRKATPSRRRLFLIPELELDAEVLSAANSSRVVLVQLPNDASGGPIVE